MRKYYVKDEDGERFEVEELTETPEKMHDDDALTEDEISALKQLAAVAPKLIALVSETHDEDEDDEMHKKTETEDEDEEEITEEVIDTDEEEEKMTRRDSKKSFGAIEKKKKAKDSTDNAHEIEIAWAKRYGGK